MGSGGYKGPPDADGVVEIGYGLLPAWEGRGLATEAARELVRRAFADPRVGAVAAETLPHLVGSIRVMEKCGMTFERRKPAQGEEPEIVRYRVARGGAAR